MFDLTSPEFWIISATGLVIGLFIGWLLTSLIQRRQNRGQNVAQMRKEMDDYRAEVNEHFARTADLFKESSEKYRDLYEHLSGGAQSLCNDLPDRTQVEFRPGRLLADTAGEASDHAADTQADSALRDTATKPQATV